MPKVDLQQGSQKWLDYRYMHIMATDAAIIMHEGLISPIELWQQKRKITPPPEVNDAMMRGQRLEPEARELFNELTGFNMVPCVYEHDVHSWAAASLDGISEDGTTLLEIKCMGEKGHKEAITGIVKSYYRIQMQHQLFVTGAKRCYYFSYRPEYVPAFSIKEVYPDPEYMEHMRIKEKEFYDTLVDFEEPMHLYCMFNK